MARSITWPSRVSLRIGALTLVDEPVVIVDLGQRSRSAQLRHEPQIDGIIGADILFPTKAVLDCQRQLLILNVDPDVAGDAPGFDRDGLKLCQFRSAMVSICM